MRAEEKESYVELQITPGNQRSQLRFPDGVAVEAARRNGGLEKFMIWDEAFHSKTWIENGQWQVYAEVPSALVRGSDESIENMRWRFSFGRYDYTRGRERPVISSTSPHAKCDFHRQQEWGVMAFNNSL
ncbi:MAG: hypothetical protein ACREFE_13775 [Limisphaerales bacterium]